MINKVAPSYVPHKDVSNREVWNKVLLKFSFVPEQERVAKLCQSPHLIRFGDRMEMKPKMTMIVQFHSKSEADLILSRRHTISTTGLKFTPSVPEQYRDAHKNFFVKEIALLDTMNRNKKLYRTRIEFRQGHMLLEYKPRKGAHYSWLCKEA